MEVSCTEVDAVDLKHPLGDESQWLCFVDIVASNVDPVVFCCTTCLASVVVPSSKILTAFPQSAQMSNSDLIL